MRQKKRTGQARTGQPCQKHAGPWTGADGGKAWITCD
jgi:hypothetical protein